MRAILLAAVLALGADVASADEALDALVDAVNRAGAAPKTEAATVERIARAVAVAPPALRARQAQAGLPWGDVLIAHRVASRGGHPLEKVVEARKSGATWTIIAGEARVDEALLAQDLTAAFPELARAVVPPAARTPAAAASSGPAAPEAKKPASLKDRLLDFLRPRPPADDKDTLEADRAREEIRDRMLRGNRGR
jgi:hypothetical protein